MEGFLPTLIIVLVIAAMVAAYIWYLKRSGYLGDIEDPDEEIAREDSYRARFKTQENKAAQLCDRYSKL
jgi:Tfp pilus assembly protein PilO